MRLVIGFLILSLIFGQCSEKKNIVEQPEKVILIQPFKDMSDNDVEFISQKIKEVYPNVKILEPIELPSHTYYKPRNRYRADTLIRYLAGRTEANFVTLGLTSRDISTTKGKVSDFGVMGLGFRPGKSCVASSFRLDKNRKNEQHFKVAIHELGHTQGLKHCPIKTCYMRDAEGKNPTDEEIEFCEKCRKFLKEKNWKI